MDKPTQKEPAALSCPLCGDDRTYREEFTTAVRCEHCGKFHAVGRMGPGWMVIAALPGGRRRSRCKTPQRRTKGHARKRKNTERRINGRAVKIKP